ncbi:hypothetical protein TrCOL_g4022 [Triparma columacea]|uniref:Tetratricopeptide repeat protein n=1 Tax=Triparma columacea TaxID=722753 RepID=A0A9W7GIE9_9STRA|nr:hypothetical protein TrCOL_g4022 [Triparma columacea]
MDASKSRLLAKHPTISDISKYNPMNDPNLPPFARNLSWQDIGRRVEAKEYWKTKMKQNPGNARYHHHVAPLYGEINDTRNEIKHHKLAVNYNPGSANARNDYGLALYKQGRYDQAELQLQEAISINRKHTTAMNNLAAVLCKKGKFTKAQEMCERVITLDSSNAMAHRNIAKIFDILGNTRDAVKHNRIAIQLGPGIQGRTHHPDTMTYRNLARQLVARGQTDSGHACEHYDAYRALAYKVNVLPNSEKTKELLVRTKTKF